MQNNSRISQAEWEVMKVLWAQSPATANDVVNALSEKTLWNSKTIRTLINRLVKKKILAFEKKGRQYHYRPLATEMECVRAETASFLSRVRGGPVKPMLAALLEEQQLSAEEIAELKRILDEKVKD